MSLTPSYGDRLAAPVVRLYRSAEQVLLRWLANQLGQERGTGRTWLMRTLGRLPKFRRGVHRIVADLDQRMPTLVNDAVTAAWRDGARAARADIGSTDAHHDEKAIRALVDRVVALLNRTHRQIPITAESIYRRAADQAARDERATSEESRRVAVLRVLQRLVRDGLTGLVDPRGRRFEVAAFAETTVRTAITAAEVDGYCQQLAAEGYDLFIVSDVVGSCELCSPFEGQVISITGSTIGAIAREAITGRSVTVTVMCSLAEARERGLFHRSCRHEIKVWTPDDPAPPRTVRTHEADRAARRRRRVLERRDRARQRQALVARSL